MDPASQKSIDAIVHRIGDKRVVAIGEETHGTGEYITFRHALTKRLIEKEGFTMVILENPHEDMVKLQADFGKVPLDTLMRRHLFEIYQTAEMKAFLQWVLTEAKKVSPSGWAVATIASVILRPASSKNAWPVSKIKPSTKCWMNTRCAAA